jgi:hypothetical protein
MKTKKSPCIAVLWCAGAIVLGCEKKPQATEWESTGPTALTVTAEGTQSYRCESGNDGKLVWKSTGPQAELFDDKHQQVGTHSKSGTGPQWEMMGDKIVGTKLHERASARVGSIPELQLSGKCTGSGTIFGKVVMIERLDTEGGIEPTTEGHKAGDEVKVEYKARYVFHTAKT